MKRLFQKLSRGLKPDLIIIIEPKNAKKNHPKGIYKIPNKVILKFIEEKENHTTGQRTRISIR